MYARKCRLTKDMRQFYNALGFVIGDLFRYRYRVSLQNLARAFPSASYAEINQQHRLFYRNIARVLTESLCPRIQQLEMESESIDLLRTAQATGKPIILLTGHYGNWEVLNKLPLQLGTPIQALYKPLKSKFWDRMFRKIRCTNGVRLLPAQQASRILIREKEQQHITIFIADQFPGKNNGLAIDFLSQDTHMFTGAEQLAKRLDAAVFYLQLNPKDTRSWSVSLQAICTQASLTTDGQITKSYTRKLEESIRQNPSLWLWTHKRWK